jgi:hypothetical protein
VRLGRIQPPRIRVRFDPDEGGSLRLLGTPGDAPEVRIGGPARSLALLAWGRTTPDDPTITIAGDHSLLEELLASGLTP